MTNLAKLKVSLTKHGAHKLAILFRYFDSSEVLNNLWGKVPGVKIDKPQALKNLSASGGKVPSLWDEARARGEDTVNGLVLIAIIFSHHKLIEAMMSSSDEKLPFCGAVVRGKHLSGKAFTNFAHTLEELGFTTGHTDKDVHYNLEKIFSVAGLNELAVKLFALKMKTASGELNYSVVDKLLSHDLQKVFSISKSQFDNWLTTGKLSAHQARQDIDSSFFDPPSDLSQVIPFVFRSGHVARKVGKVNISPAKREAVADLLHNSMQTALYQKLVEQYGAHCVGTEIPTGAGTSIDVVVKTEDFCCFYEIKTADTVKGCIRQGLPQLLEYAYWHGKMGRADRLIVVGPIAINKDAERYLKFLREMFNLPIAYMELTVRS